MDTFRRLPIGVQDFEKLRTAECVYVDKTEYIYKLTREVAPYFLGRPRRFGKSLFLSTLRYYFEGRKELFEGLKITEFEKEWVEHPVFYIDFNRGGFESLQSLNSVLNYNLTLIESQWGKTDTAQSLSVRFSTLIKTAHEKSGKKVVVLIDEYDKPLLSTMDEEKLNEEMRKVLKGFYGVLKAEDTHLRFVFLTGVTKFSQVSIFSDLNQLQDISLDSRFSGICGISETELLANFEPEINALAAKNNTSNNEVCVSLKKRYDGYRFSENMEGMYNPFSLLNTFSSQTFRYYWFATGTPTFLVKMIKNAGMNLPDFENNVTIAANSIMDYRIENLDPVPVLYQSGYLTIKSYNQAFDEYILGYPNEEVKYGFLNELAMSYLPVSSEFDCRRFCKDLIAGNVEQFMLRLQSFFAGIPYDLENKSEKHYHTAFYLLFAMMGQFIKVEEHSAVGSADAIVELADTIYIFEFKLTGNASAEIALQQIEAKNYAAKYRLSGKKIIQIGVTFDNDKRTVGEWLVKE